MNPLLQNVGQIARSHLRVWCSFFSLQWKSIYPCIFLRGVERVAPTRETNLHIITAVRIILKSLLRIDSTALFWQSGMRLHRDARGEGQASKCEVMIVTIDTAISRNRTSCEHTGECQWWSRRSFLLSSSWGFQTGGRAPYGANGKLDWRICIISVGRLIWKSGRGMKKVRIVCSPRNHVDSRFTLHADLVPSQTAKVAQRCVWLCNED